MQAVWVQSLVGELRPHISQSHKTKTENRSNINKDFKNGPHKKILKIPEVLSVYYVPGNSPDTRV